MDIQQFAPLARMETDVALSAAVPLLRGVARDSRLLLRLPIAACDRTASAPLVEQLGSIDGLSLQLFLWPGNVWTPIHDHTSWGICLCLEGRLIEDRYERLDEQSQPDRAHLRHMWRATWRSGEHSSLLPYAGGIHRVGNPTAERAVTLHVYGPRLSAIDGRDYDPQRDLVCDRPIERLEPIAA